MCHATNEATCRWQAVLLSRPMSETVVLTGLPTLLALVHKSTAPVSGDRRGMVLESELDRGQRARNVVEATKLRAEKIVRNAAREVPVIVVRPTTVIGDSQTGEVDRLDGPYLLVL